MRCRLSSRRGKLAVPEGWAHRCSVCACMYVCVCVCACMCVCVCVCAWHVCLVYYVHARMRVSSVRSTRAYARVCVYFGACVSLCVCFCRGSCVCMYACVSVPELL